MTKERSKEGLDGEEDGIKGRTRGKVVGYFYLQDKKGKQDVREGEARL